MNDEELYKNLIKKMGITVDNPSGSYSQMKDFWKDPAMREISESFTNANPITLHEDSNGCEVIHFGDDRDVYEKPLPSIGDVIEIKGVFFNYSSGSVYNFDRTSGESPFELNVLVTKCNASGVVTGVILKTDNSQYPKGTTRQFPLSSNTFKSWRLLA